MILELSRPSVLGGAGTGVRGAMAGIAGSTTSPLVTGAGKMMSCVDSTAADVGAAGEISSALAMPIQAAINVKPSEAI